MRIALALHFRSSHQGTSVLRMFPHFLISEQVVWKLACPKPQASPTQTEDGYAPTLALPVAFCMLDFLTSPLVRPRAGPVNPVWT